MKELNISALVAQVQVMDAVLTALIETHPRPDELRDSMKSHIALAIASSTSHAIQRGASLDIPNRMRAYGDNQLQILDG